MKIDIIVFIGWIFACIILPLSIFFIVKTKNVYQTETTFQQFTGMKGIENERRKGNIGGDFMASDKNKE